MAIQKGNGATFSRQRKKSSVCPAPIPPEQPAETIQFIDLPKDVQTYIMTLGLKDNPHFPTYTQKLMFGKDIVHDIEKEKTFLEPEEIHVSSTVASVRNFMTGQPNVPDHIFTNVQAFQDFLNTNGESILERSTIIFRGKGVHMNITIPKKDTRDVREPGAININVMLPNTTHVLATLYLEFFQFGGRGVRDIIISKLKLTLILHQHIHSEEAMNALHDIFVGVYWLYNVFKTITFDRCFRFETLDNVLVEYYQTGSYIPLSISAYTLDPTISQRILLILKNIGNILTVQQKKQKKKQKKKQQTVK